MVKKVHTKLSKCQTVLAQGTCQCTVARSTHVGNRRTTKVSYNMKMFLLFNFVTFRK